VKGNVDVIELLNDVLGGELVSINQYFVHAKMCDNWGYKRLAHKIRSESIEEMKHAEELVERILFLEGVPNLQKLGTLHIGETVREQFESDSALERDAIKKLNDGLQLCRDKGDGASEDLLQRILKSEEEHLDWLEIQLGLLDKIGEKHYLAQQLRE
jgi:bacterioferritin